MNVWQLWISLLFVVYLKSPIFYTLYSCFLKHVLLPAYSHHRVTLNKQNISSCPYKLQCRISCRPHRLYFKVFKIYIASCLREWWDLFTGIIRFIWQCCQQHRLLSVEWQGDEWVINWTGCGRNRWCFDWPYTRCLYGGTEESHVKFLSQYSVPGASSECRPET